MTATLQFERLLCRVVGHKVSTESYHLGQQAYYFRICTRCGRIQNPEPHSDQAKPEGAAT